MAFYERSELFGKYPKTPVLDHSNYRLFERIPAVPGTSNNQDLTVLILKMCASCMVGRCKKLFKFLTTSNFKHAHGISGRKYTLIFHMNHLPDNSHEMSFLIWFLLKTATNFKSVVCLIRSTLLSRKKCVITANTIFLHRPRRELYWIHDTFICCGIKLCTIKLHNTEPDICDL